MERGCDHWFSRGAASEVSWVFPGSHVLWFFLFKSIQP